jgi:serine/threonine-protein kinase SBK
MCLNMNVREQVGLAEHHAKSVARQVVSALDYMHSKDLVHRDIKPENIMLFDEQFHRVKLMDFGLTKKRGTQVLRCTVAHGFTFTGSQ